MKFMTNNFWPTWMPFEEWCHLLERVQHEFIVYFDHKNLQYFMTVHVLNRCQV